MKLQGLKDVPSDVACTSMPQAWHVPRGEKIEPVAVNEIVAAKPRLERARDPSTPSSSLQSPLNVEFLNEVANLSKLEGTPLEYIATNQAPLVNTEHGVAQLGAVACYQVCNPKLSNFFSRIEDENRTVSVPTF